MILKPVLIPARYVAVTDVVHRNVHFFGVDALFHCMLKIPMAKLVLKQE